MHISFTSARPSLCALGANPLFTQRHEASSDDVNVTSLTRSSALEECTTECTLHPTPPVHRSTRLHFKLLKFSLYDACMTVPAGQSARPQSGSGGWEGWSAHHNGKRRPWLSSRKLVTQWWASYSPANKHTHTHTMWLVAWLVEEMFSW